MKIPFMFRLWNAPGGASNKWCVKLASFDYAMYDSAWMHDKTLGANCLRPDVDIEHDSFVFDSEKDALKCMQRLWTERDFDAHSCPECGGDVTEVEPHDACFAAHHARCNI